jgi:hypothetical protein
MASVVEQFVEVRTGLNSFSVYQDIGAYCLVNEIMCLNTQSKPNDMQILTNRNFVTVV